MGGVKRSKPGGSRQNGEKNREMTKAAKDAIAPPIETCQKVGFRKTSPNTLNGDGICRAAAAAAPPGSE